MKTDTQPQADMIRTMFAAGDTAGIAGLLDFLTDDVVMVFGNASPVVGKEAIKMRSSELLSAVKEIRHEIHDIWHAAEDAAVLIARMTVHYSKLDGSVVSVPCVNLFRLRDGLVADYRIYIDVSPVFA